MLCRTGNSVISLRLQSSLADKLRAVVSGDVVEKKASSERSARHDADMQSASFNEMFVMPKRKLRGQLLIEQATGRANVFKRSRMDIHDRLAVRRPRCEEMATDQVVFLFANILFSLCGCLCCGYCGFISLLVTNIDLLQYYYTFSYAMNGLDTIALSRLHRWRRG
ncbi:unnamed protein product [Heligmosomoides polygyrus]|uniref:Transmembrane protein n=1 Tax=Heligmosomoides polygyrus TaxID=6339 RepID=A0A183FBE8_HELPZ|nr:unnamed protein product [Heligmosomoides polygyrus]